ncbi:hypothetical protein FQR65_LT04878 [Abscondita terminalis]|nr:hypothetical protein FQR65_LT04878 [Abscondita terminalis]
MLRSFSFLLLCLSVLFQFVASQSSTSAPLPPIPVDFVIVNTDDCIAANGNCLLDGDCSGPYTDADRSLCGNKDPRIGCCKGGAVIMWL